MAKASVKERLAKLEQENAELRHALHLLHGRSCRQSDFIYSVLHGKRREAIRDLMLDNEAASIARTKRFKARCAEIITKRRESVRKWQRKQKLKTGA